MSSDKGNYAVLKVRKPAYIELSQGARMKLAQKHYCSPKGRVTFAHGSLNTRPYENRDPLPGKYQRGDVVTSRIFAAGATGKILGLANEHGVYHVLGSDGKRYVCHVEYMRPHPRPLLVNGEGRMFKTVKPKPNVIFIPGCQAETHPKAWGVAKVDTEQRVADRVEERIRQSNERMKANFHDIYNRRNKASAMGGR